MEYHHLTAQERYLIVHHKSNGCSLRQIAEMLNRSVSTISRELKRNVSGDGRYRPDKADSYLHKRSCFKGVTQRQCNEIERELNDRPRKVLGFNTPNEAEAEECCA